MLDAIKTVFDAVATKDIVPILTHILIYEGRMQAGDGVVTIDCPFPNNIPPCAVPGQKLLNAVKACKDVPNLSITPTGKLVVKKGSFRAMLSTLPKEDFPLAEPMGAEFSVPSNFITVIAHLRPFVSKDASRPWSMGILFKEGYAYATNNITLVRQAIDWDAPDTLIPIRALDDLLTMKENPGVMKISDNDTTFFYKDESWLKSQTLLQPWPNVEAMLEASEAPEDDVPATLLDDVIRVHAFCTNQKFPEISIGETVQSGEGDDQAIIEGYDLPKSRWHADQLTLVLSHANKIDFSPYPKPCTFSNNKGVFGIFVGVRT